MKNQDKDQNNDTTNATSFMYHSFPRPRIRNGETSTSAETVSRGWDILQAMKDIGLILAPEVVEWRVPAGVSLGIESPIRIFQQRISFTQLTEQELYEHSKQFGPFALEFEVAELRRAGALPVIYMPQPLSAEDHLALIGVTIVVQLEQVRHTLGTLRVLNDLGSQAFLKDQGAETIAEDCIVTLNNTDSSRGTVQQFQIPWQTIKNILDYINFETASFDAMGTAISLSQSLFYPTDDEHQGQELGYYKQREWRITAGYNVNGVPRGRELQNEEKERLIKTNESFWEKHTHSSRQTLRIDDALVLQPMPDEMLEMTTRIIVPDDFFDRAHKIFGDKVVAASQLRKPEQ